MNIWSPHVDPHQSRAGLLPERYALRIAEAGPFLGLFGGDEQIREVSAAEQAYTFHTQEGALRVARELSSLSHRPVNVVKLL
ncbi:MAG: hypothetical protein ACKOBY_01830 [Cyanobium sp.]